MESQKQKKLMDAFMEKLLIKYCKLNSIKVEDIKGKSREKGLPTHRHIFAYCMREYYRVKLWRIGKALNKEQTRYGIRLVKDFLELYKDKDVNVVPPTINLIKIRIKAFINVCKKYDRPDRKDYADFSWLCDDEHDTTENLNTDVICDIEKYMRNNPDDADW